MTCYHPLRRFEIGTNKLTGKSIGKVVPYDVKYLEFKNGSYEFHDGEIPEKNDHIIKNSVLIPCGNCIGCRLDYSRQWADRMMLEAQNHDNNCFVTLTYNDDFLPFNSTGTVINDGNGVSIDYDFPTLQKRDLQLFLKRLRIKLKREKDISIRFYAAGEYGSNTHRPHYHLIIFGWFPDDAIYFQQRNGFVYYTSKTLEDCWSVGKKTKLPIGFSLVTNVSWETCAYVARYVTKKHKGKDKDFYLINHIEPEFSTMSRKPGIAYDFYLEHKDDFFRYDCVNIQLPSTGKKIHTPAYFNRLFDIEEFSLDGITAADRKLKRQFNADKRIENLLKNTQLSYMDYLTNKETTFLQKASFSIKEKNKRSKLNRKEVKL